MRVFIVAMAITLLTVPAFAQTANGIGAAQGAGRAARPPEEPKADPAKAKADEKAFKEGVSRIPDPDKKFDPWGNLRQGGK
jgi:hypothetical protein